MVRRSRIAAWVGLALIPFSGSIAVADPEVFRATLDRPAPRESYSGRADVSGTELVGLMLGAPAVLSFPPEVTVVQPTPGEPSRLCIRVVTRDGLFWSDNPFDIAASPSASVVAGPISVDERRLLSRYSPEQVLVRAAVPQGGKCSDLSAVRVYAPARGDDAGGDVLRVQLNTHGLQAHARLLTHEDTPEVISSTACGSVEKEVAVAADRECVLDVSSPKATGLVDLHVVILSLERRHLHYPVRLPGRP